MTATIIEKYFSRLLLAVTGFVVSLMLLPVSVLTSWKLTTDKGSYNVGDQISLTTTYDKKFNIKGQSNRSLECKTPTGSVTYPIFFSYAGGQPGKHTTVSKVTIPTIEQKLPILCRVDIDLLYVVAGVKPVKQSNVSNDFWVNPGKE